MKHVLCGTTFTAFVTIMCAFSLNITSDAEPAPTIESLSARFAAIRTDKSADAVEGLAAGVTNRAGTLDEAAKVSLWLMAYQKLKAECDPSFDPADVPAINIAAPGRYPSGISPESITEPDLRKQYVQALAVNREKTERHVRQSSLRKQLKELKHDLPLILGGSDSDREKRTRNAIETLKKYKVSDELLIEIAKP